MSLERIDKVIWPDGTKLKSDAGHRKKEMGRLGFPAEKIITDYAGQDLDTINAVEAVLRDIGDPPPDNFHLLVVPGSMEGSWVSLVRKAYEVILERKPLSNSERRDLLRTAIDPVLNMLRKGHEFEKPADFPTQGTIDEMIRHFVSRIRAEIDKNKTPDSAMQLQEIISIVRRKMIIVLLSRGMRVQPGKVAAHLGLIDGAFDMSDLERHADTIVAVLEEIIASRLS